jgi:AraC-like DNA-binding protein
MTQERQKSVFEWVDESVPVHEDIGRDHPMVIFGDNRLCAGKSLVVRCMPGPHMHSQVEMNLVLEGSMTYWFDRRIINLPAGSLALFWGMMPHQVIEVRPETRFVCFYAPVSMFLGLPTMSRLREALFHGAVIEANRVHSYDRELFLRWRDDLESTENRVVDLVRDELTARVRRLEIEGWRDMRADARAAPLDSSYDAERIAPVEIMSRYIGENGRKEIRVDEVARASGLHPNYAMQLFKRAVGMSLKQAITRHRLDAAQSMLIASDRAIASIAFECGFRSLSSFYEAFERRFNASPAQFRRGPAGRYS